MKAFLDSSVLVAAFYGDHTHHDASFDVLTRFPRKVACCGAQSLLEVYSTLTRMPGKYRINPEQAMLFIGSLEERLTIIGLTAEEYLETLKLNAEMGVTGGVIYDALLAACAIKAGAEKLFTWNLRHYALLGDKVQPLLQTP